MLFHLFFKKLWLEWNKVTALHQKHKVIPEMVVSLLVMSLPVLFPVTSAWNLTLASESASRSLSGFWWIEWQND
jgi:hypothetical protein